MSEQNLSPEQKLDAIYVMLKKQESSRKRMFFFRILKWTIIICFFYAVLTHSNEIFPSVKQLIEPVISNLIQTMKPMILEQARTIMKDQISTT